jgi:hypothetical protein
VIARQGALLLLASLASADTRRPNRCACRWPAWTPSSSATPATRCRSPTWLARRPVGGALPCALAETGQTPMDVRLRRLQLGRELLGSSQLAVGEIAARVGYASQSAFTAALVRQFGCTPRQLRREARDKLR